MAQAKTSAPPKRQPCPRPGQSAAGPPAPRHRSPPSLSRRWLTRPRAAEGIGRCEPDRVERAVHRDVQPPVPVEEEQEPERDQRQTADQPDDGVTIAQPAE